MKGKTATGMDQCDWAGSRRDDSDAPKGDMPVHWAGSAPQRLAVYWVGFQAWLIGFVAPCCGLHLHGSAPYSGVTTKSSSGMAAVGLQSRMGPIKKKQ